MLNRYKKSGIPLFIRKAMLDMEVMKAELNEHRYYLERNVERRTAYLTHRIALLESCNAALCDKLASAQKDLAALKQQPVYALPNKDTESNERAVKLYVMNNPVQNPLGSNAQGMWGEHATAA